MDTLGLPRDNVISLVLPEATAVPLAATVTADDVEGVAGADEAATTVEVEVGATRSHEGHIVRVVAGSCMK